MTSVSMHMFGIVGAALIITGLLKVPAEARDASWWSLMGGAAIVQVVALVGMFWKPKRT